MAELNWGRIDDGSIFTKSFIAGLISQNPSAVLYNGLNITRGIIR